jgi:hypothetical protein
VIKESLRHIINEYLPTESKENYDGNYDGGTCTYSDDTGQPVTAITVSASRSRLAIGNRSLHRGNQAKTIYHQIHLLGAQSQ